MEGRAHLLVTSGVLLGLLAGGCGIGLCDYEIRSVSAEPGQSALEGDSIGARFDFYQTRGDRSRRNVDWRIMAPDSIDVSRIVVRASPASVGGESVNLRFPVDSPDPSFLSSGSVDFPDQPQAYDRIFAALLQGSAELVLSSPTRSDRVIPLLPVSPSDWYRAYCS